MSLLGNLFGGRDRQLAATRYAGQESATAKASRQRREKHRSKGIRRAARAAERWEAADRRRFG